MSGRSARLAMALVASLTGLATAQDVPGGFPQDPLLAPARRSPGVPAPARGARARPASKGRPRTPSPAQQAKAARARSRAEMAARQAEWFAALADPGFPVDADDPARPGVPPNGFVVPNGSFGTVNAAGSFTAINGFGGFGPFFGGYGGGYGGGIWPYYAAATGGIPYANALASGRLMPVFPASGGASSSTAALNAATDNRLIHGYDGQFPDFAATNGNYNGSVYHPRIEDVHGGSRVDGYGVALRKGELVNGGNLHPRLRRDRIARSVAVQLLRLGRVGAGGDVRAGLRRDRIGVREQFVWPVRLRLRAPVRQRGRERRHAGPGLRRDGRQLRVDLRREFRPGRLGRHPGPGPRGREALRADDRPAWPRRESSPSRGPRMPVSEASLSALIDAARSASAHAYCPYSRFRVGAAVLTGDGRIVPGCNVENASYGLTICAERNAVFRAVAGGPTEILAVAIYTPTPVPSAPCGACRQVLNEFGPSALVLSACDGPDLLRRPLSDLLPDAFGPRNLGVD